MKAARPRAFDAEAWADEIEAGNRTILARAITLVESTRADHRRQAQQLLVTLLGRGHSGPGASTQRVGITGVPGSGKSTFIDALGMQLIDGGHRVAVLAVDPSSTRTGGSILGDKTRMAHLANHEHAFIRPSPSAGTLGGVARATREAIVLVESAGYDVVLVETVGVGQSETAVADMVDCFLVLLLARTGDSLQGIKKGVLELADVLAVNKADGDRALEAEKAARELADALHLLGPSSTGWAPPVLTCSALERRGLDEVWRQVQAHRAVHEASGAFAERRRRQQVAWMWAAVEDRLLSRLRATPEVQALVPRLEAEVQAGTTTPTLAADALLEAFGLPPD